jgi:hypothetical protein
MTTEIFWKMVTLLETRNDRKFVLNYNSNKNCSNFTFGEILSNFKRANTSFSEDHLRSFQHNDYKFSEKHCQDSRLGRV